MGRIGIPVVRSLAVAALAAALALTASPAHAAKCAKPGGGGGCSSTIQAAVDAAGAGESVFVYPGRYTEGVTVPAGKNGLMLVGLGKSPAAVRVEASGLGTAGVEIHSDGVAVRNLTVRGAVNGIFSFGSGTQVTRVHVIGVQGSGIAIAGANAVVLASRVKGCTGMGIYIIGPDAFVRGVNVTLTAGIIVQGDRGRVIGARVIASQGTGVMVNGASPQVRDCRIRGGVGGGVIISATAAAPAVSRVTRNRVYGSMGGGVMAIASGPALVAGNVAQDIMGIGVYYSCSADCGDARVSANVARGTIVGPGFGINATTPGVAVAGNRATENGLTGFEIHASGSDVRDNVAVGNGRFDPSNTAPATGGFVIEGDLNVLQRNVSRGNAEAGFDVVGSSNTLAGNRAEGNFGHGFVVGGEGPAPGTILNGNRAVDNVAYGIYLSGGASNVTVTNNRAGANSYSPFCDPIAGATVFSGNNFISSLCMP